MPLRNDDFSRRLGTVPRSPHSHQTGLSSRKDAQPRGPYDVHAGNELPRDHPHRLEQQRVTSTPPEPPK